MKKFMTLVAAALLATMTAGAQDETVQPYFELSELPELYEIMPAPPAFESPEFANDIVRYCWGKQQRMDPERVALAIADAEWDDHTKVFGQYAEAFGLTITPEDTPEIWKLLETSLATTDPMRKYCKAQYGRQRPFERFDDAMPSHEEDDLRGEGSYPSGHSLRGWGIALLLSQIAPERANEIFRRGWDYCNSRVIVGAHWQSDVDASRTAASIGFCALQGSPEFRAQMEKAQEEYAVKTGQTVGVETVAPAAQAPAQQYIFNVEGRRTTEQTRGIKVQNGRKYVTQ
jgi:acid phosphatase (class A)